VEVSSHFKKGERANKKTAIEEEAILQHTHCD